MNTQAPIEFTKAAVAKVRELLLSERNPAASLRIFVQGGGCSGFKYGFAFEDVANTDDTAFTVDGVTFLVDPMSYMYLAGASVDYEEKLDGSRFIVNNPNAKISCGCGSSFTV